MTVRFYSSVAAETTLVNTATPASTTIIVGATTGFPALTPYTLALDYEGATEELVDVTSVAGTSLTVTRAVDGTSATTHNAGARVRHVSSGRDYADSRSHENASANIHGLGPGSALVGTLETQTLVNKTLTSPIVNTPAIAGGSSTGTISGSATYTGTRIFSGEIQHSNLYRGSRATTGDSQWETRVTGDANARFFVRADGAHRWGPGTTLADSTFERVGINQFRSDSAIRSERPSSSNNAFQARRSADTGEKWRVTADGTMFWGDGAGAYPYSIVNSGPSLQVTAPDLDIFGTVNVIGTLQGSDINATSYRILTGAASASAGWSLTSATAIRSGGVTTWSALLSRTGGTITASATGNITDTPIVTIPTEWLPAVDITNVSTVPTNFVATNTSGGALLNSSGLCSLTDMNGSGSTIVNGDVVRLSYTYVTDHA